tara:strand:- start:823 stop:1506 length:684 start_codon:yes stop_codon:yes gene_type:complete
MKKVYKIIFLLITFIFLSTYNPAALNNFPEKKNIFFKIQKIDIENSNLIDKEEVINSLDHIYGQNIFFIKKEDLEIPLKSLDFLKTIEVKKIYPNKIIIKLYETQPIAILFKKNDKYILDDSSNLIAFNKNLQRNDFPNVFGEDAEKFFVRFFIQLEDLNFPKHKIKNYYYFQINRWDIQLLNEQTIKFPAKKLSEAIKESIKLLEREDFKNYKVIDLRIHGKIVVE